MATATLKSTTAVVRNVILELTPDEAETLLLITGYIGGLKSGRRKHSDAIGKALRDVGVWYSYEENRINPKVAEGAQIWLY